MLEVELELATYRRDDEGAVRTRALRLARANELALRVRMVWKVWKVWDEMAKI